MDDLLSLDINYIHETANATNQWAKGTFFTHRVIISWTNRVLGQHNNASRGILATYKGSLGLVIRNHVTGDIVSTNVKRGVERFAHPAS